EAQPLLVVGDAGQPVLAPAVGAGPGLVVGEVVPGVAAVAVVLADRPPLAFAEVRAPLLPGDLALLHLHQPVVFRGHGALTFSKHPRPTPHLECPRRPPPFPPIPRLNSRQLSQPRPANVKLPAERPGAKMLAPRAPMPLVPLLPAVQPRPRLGPNRA